VQGKKRPHFQRFPEGQKAAKGFSGKDLFGLCALGGSILFFIPGG
jgi:hypothetical protein